MIKNKKKPKKNYKEASKLINQWTNEPGDYDTIVGDLLEKSLKPYNYQEMIDRLKNEIKKLENKSTPIKSRRYLDYCDGWRNALLYVLEEIFEEEYK